MKKLIKSLDYACSGIVFAFKNERNFRIHTMAFAVIVLFGILFRLDHLEWALIFICVGVVHTAELINTAIERTWNHLEPNHHPVVAIVKDVMAGAVLVSATMAVIVAGFIFFPKVF